MQSEPEEKIDLSKQEAIPSKLTVSTLNQYLYNTSDFINKFFNFFQQKKFRFATFSQNYLMNLEEKLEKLDSQVLLLEAKLNSLPANIFEQAPPPQPEQQQPQQQQQPQVQEPQTLPQIGDEEPIKLEEKPSEPPEHLQTYIKMLKLKIPQGAVSMKMQMDGLSIDDLRPYIHID